MSPQEEVEGLEMRLRACTASWPAVGLTLSQEHVLVDALKDALALLRRLSQPAPTSEPELRVETHYCVRQAEAAWEQDHHTDKTLAEYVTEALFAAGLIRASHQAPQAARIEWKCWACNHWNTAQNCRCGELGPQLSALRAVAPSSVAAVGAQAAEQGERPRCRLFSYGWSNDHHPGYVVYRGARIGQNVEACFVQEDAADLFCKIRNRLVDERGDDSLPQAEEPQVAEPLCVHGVYTKEPCEQCDAEWTMSYGGGPAPPRVAAVGSAAGAGGSTKCSSTGGNTK